jgi:hypothetical protein
VIRTLALTASVGVALACSRSPSAPAPTSEPVSIPAPSATAAEQRSPEPKIVPDARSEIDAWIVSRLTKPGQKLLDLDYDWRAVHGARPGVEAARAYWVEDPAMWLLLIRFASGADAAAAREPLLEATDQPERPPYNAKATTTGAYLLIIGFASDKPVSPEMARHRDEYLAAFAGEE